MGISVTRHIIQTVDSGAPSFRQPIICTLGLKKRQDAGEKREEGRVGIELHGQKHANAPKYKNINKRTIFQLPVK